MTRPPQDSEDAGGAAALRPPVRHSDPPPWHEIGEDLFEDLCCDVHGLSPEIKSAGRDAEGGRRGKRPVLGSKQAVAWNEKRSTTCKKAGSYAAWQLVVRRVDTDIKRTIGASPQMLELPREAGKRVGALV